jgi:hypothetical protein
VCWARRMVEIGEKGGKKEIKRDRENRTYAVMQLLKNL